MSVRAYKIKKIEAESSSSFNLWHSTIFVSKLGVYSQLNKDDSGLAYVSVKDLQKYSEEYKETLEDYEIKQIKQDIKEAKKYNEKYILYWCK